MKAAQRLLEAAASSDAQFSCTFTETEAFISAGLPLKRK